MAVRIGTAAVISLAAVALVILAASSGPSIFIGSLSNRVEDLSIGASKQLELAAVKTIPLDEQTVHSSFSVNVPANWKVGAAPLQVAIPGRGVMAIHVPPTVKPGQTLYFQIAGSQPSSSTQGFSHAESSPIPAARPHPQRIRGAASGGDLTSYSSMLTMERRIRETMGKIHNTWKDNPKAFVKAKQWVAAAGSMLAATADSDAAFIPFALAPKAKGWDPTNRNGFPAKPPNSENINGVPGYTFTLNGKDLDVTDQGPGYYQPVDPEHSALYLSLVKNDCFSKSSEPWRDHSNCAALLRRSHTYPNSDPWRFSGAFGWNPPFPPGVNATNVKGAFAPEENEYWNYGSDSDRASALQWNGKAYVDPKAAEAAAHAAKDAADAAAAAKAAAAAAPPPAANATAA